MELIANPLFLLFLSTLSGILLGRIKIGKFRFGYSGVLISSLLISWIVLKLLISKGYPQNYELAPESFFLFSLILFISSVGLLAGKKIIIVMKEYGFKFLILAIIITFVGYVATIFLSNCFGIYDKYIISGLFTGALTSTPGLAASLENAGNAANATNIGLGHTLAYVPGVLIVIFSMYLFPHIFKIDIEKEKKLLKNYSNIDESNHPFDFLAYSIVVIIGLLIGEIKVKIGVASFSLGITGGVLVSSLIFGSLKKIGKLHFDMNDQSLNVLKELGLLLFLSSVGLRYGYKSISSANVESLNYLLISFLAGFVAIFTGFIIGKYIFKINWIILSGAICGGMTSTPGLGAAIDSTKSNNPTHGYGATYPFALIFMVIFVILGLK
jgi:putative transport protein